MTDGLTPEQRDAARRAAQEIVRKKKEASGSNILHFPISLPRILKEPPPPKEIDEKFLPPTRKPVWVQRVERSLPYLTLFGWALAVSLIVGLGIALWYVTHDRSSPLDGNCLIKGHVSSTGMQYFMPENPLYAKIEMDVSQGDVWLCSAAEAEKKGFRPAR